jgi:hypothetical protein
MDFIKQCAWNFFPKWNVPQSEWWGSEMRLGPKRGSFVHAKQRAPRGTLRVRKRPPTVRWATSEGLTYIDRHGGCELAGFRLNYGDSRGNDVIRLELTMQEGKQRTMK